MALRLLPLLAVPLCCGQSSRPPEVTAMPAFPLYFEQDSPGRFSSGGLQLTATEARLFVSSGTIRMSLEGANGAAWMTGLDRRPGESNYFLGADPSQWRAHVSHYGRVRAERVYPGIDLVYYGSQSAIEFDFLVAPGADPSQIRLRFDGATPRVAENGELVLHNPSSPVRLKKLVVYQPFGKTRRTVPGRFRVDPSGRVRFALGAYDKSLPLVIDPVLSYSTLLAASSANGLGIAVDASGNTYITGETGNVFRTSNALQPTLGNGRAAFVAKFNSTGTELLYATFLSGTTTESGAAPGSAGYRITVDRSGNAYLVGTTNATNFPVTAGTVQPINRGGVDLFVSKLNATGSALIYSSYLGGAQNEDASIGLPGIAIDAAGNTYVSGATASRNFPVTAGAFQTTYGGGNFDAFLAKIDPIGSTLVYSTYLGSATTDAATALAVDASGNAYLAGIADSAAFPKTPAAYQPAFKGGGGDLFLAKVNPNGTTLLYSTLLGGRGEEAAFGLAVDPAGNAFLGGFTNSADFPVTAQAFQKTAQADSSFVVKVNSAGTDLVYSTFLGGSRGDYANRLAVDAQGNAIIAGFTESPDFPVTPDAFQSGLGLRRRGAGTTAAAAAFLAKLNPAGTALLYSTYFGGSTADEAKDLALDSAGNAYLIGTASSINFPRTLSNMEPTDRAEFLSPFLARFELNSRNSMTLGSVISAASYQPGLAGVVAPGQIVVLFGNELGPAQLATLQLNSNGRVDTLLAGVRVLFDGVPAPLLYVSSKQLSAVVPYSVQPNGRTTVQVDYQGLRSNPLVLWVAPALVGIFTQDSSGRGPGAILNQDGTVNSASNPAEKGSIVTLFGTGEGRTLPEGVDGKVTAEPLPRPVLRIFAQVDNRFADVLYVGGAPGLVAGVLQMNIKIPDDARSGAAIPISIGGMDGPFGTERSEQATVAIR